MISFEVNIEKLEKQGRWIPGNEDNKWSYDRVEISGGHEDDEDINFSMTVPIENLPQVNDRVRITLEVIDESL